MLTWQQENGVPKARSQSQVSMEKRGIFYTQKSLQNPTFAGKRLASISGGNFPASFAGETNSFVMTTIFIQSPTQSRRISSVVGSGKIRKTQILFLFHSLLFDVGACPLAIKQLHLLCLNLASFLMSGQKLSGIINVSNKSSNTRGSLRQK